MRVSTLVQLLNRLDPNLEVKVSTYDQPPKTGYVDYVRVFDGDPTAFIFAKPEKDAT